MNEPSDQHPDALLADYAVAHLSPAQRRAVEGHLAGCQSCRSRLQSLAATAALLRRLPPPALPRSFVLPRTAAPPRRAAPWLLPVSFLSAAAVLFLALGLSLAAPRPTTAVAYSSAASAEQQHAAATTAAAATSAASAAASTAVAAADNTGGASAAARAAPAAQVAAVPQSTTASAPAPPPPTAADTAAAVAPRPAQPTGPPATTPIRNRLQPYQVLLTIGGVACLVLGLGTLFRAARR